MIIEIALLEFKECIVKNIGGNIYVLYNNKKIGYADIHVHNKHIKINKLVVESDYRSMGVGTALMNNIIKWCGMDKMFSVSVHARSGITLEMRECGVKGLTQKELVHFYKKFGFIEQKQEKNYFTKTFKNFLL